MPTVVDRASLNCRNLRVKLTSPRETEAHNLFGKTRRCCSIQPGNGHQLMFEPDICLSLNGCATAGTRDIGNIASIRRLPYLRFRTSVVVTLGYHVETVKLHVRNTSRVFLIALQNKHGVC
jgi:hypothetical protein